MRLDAQIRDRLQAAFRPQRLEVINESAQHAGHAGDDGSGESHWRVRISDESFEGQSRIARHRAIHAAIGRDLMDRIHALAIEIG
ncbi:BolA family protein [Wenxinia saemankumensis]|uniref:BolA protein n=1 Tax=Wenxinia saemankumensis TaxID=1447782 RepID=A0A1M6CJ77_9RHOB|nr:BolA family protein [Wenxinia saemankumensis]SHI61046.1 BolA protein [Wenxinia saemankumensis]